MSLYISTYALDIAALIYLMFLINSGTSINRNRKRAFELGIVLTIMIMLSEAGTVFAGSGGNHFRMLNVIFNMLGFSLAPLLPLAITFIFDGKILMTYKWLFIPSGINTFAVLVSPIFKIIFYVDAKNVYTRGSYFFIFVMVYVINYIILMAGTFYLGKKHNYPIKRKMMLLFLFTILGTSIQVIDPMVHSTWHCVTLTFFLYFILMSEFDSSFDTLSGLYNRMAFDKAIKERKKGKTQSVIVLDIDDFKNINDTYGHDYGDQVIRSIADIIRESFEEQYRCYRFGGDEFAIIGSEVDTEKIEFQLHKFKGKLMEEKEKSNILPTVSYGYSVKDGLDILELEKALKEADERMYEAKAKIDKTNIVKPKTNML